MEPSFAPRKALVFNMEKTLKTTQQHASNPNTVAAGFAPRPVEKNS